MTTSGNILAIPFRRTHNLFLSEAISKYISSKYDQSPEVFARDLEEIDALRKDAVTALEPHNSGITKLQAYAAQLVWMTGKFPLDIGVDFIWYPALGYHTTQARAENNIRFELANVVFNLASMYSQIALASNRTTSDGLKSAANNFCAAAGTVRYLRETITPELTTNLPEDLDAVTLQSLECLMLAQAQECFWLKAVKDGLKDALIAKLAARVSDLYSDAADHATNSNSISSEWIHHTNAKHHHFAAAAQYRAACDCLEKTKYGEEVSRLRDSLNCVNEGLKEARYINKSVLNDLNGLKNRVAEDLKRAEKDNDNIYLIPEPSKAELKKLDRANMVTSKIPAEVEHSQDYLGDRGQLGRPLFVKLVPYSAHLAASMYVQRRNRTVNDNIIAELENLSQKLHETLSAWNLPGSLQALEKPLGLPPGLASHAEEVRQTRGIQKVHSTIAETDKIKSSNRDTYQEGVEFLRQEAGEDEAARRKFGTDRWPRKPARDVIPKIYEQVNSIEGYLKQADNSDRLIQDKLRDNDSLIRLLGGSDRDLEDYVPSSRRATLTAKMERDVNTLRASINEVSRLESRRRKMVDTLRAKAKDDDVTPDLLREAARLEMEHPMIPLKASEFDHLFDARLKRYDSDTEDVKMQESEQERLLARVKDANLAFQTTKKGDTSSRDRESALQRLENAYNAYRELLRDLDSSRTFYNNLSPITTRFRDDCRHFAYARRSEGQNMEAEVSNAMAGLKIQEQTTNTLQQLQASESPTKRAAAPTPIAAPKPQRVGTQPPAVYLPAAQTWQEGMPIMFAGGEGPSDASGPQTSHRRAAK
ncbi:hypothetical protein AMS68_002979 [Peltaster fructicola]|uniref:BRO1 domain-containing protein n=1 Tax=Peltaster fructicola TaxID=286661 RepID=A0A6H0XRR9_9PEZI|nr:hypothetical protein AMS68_002979 [Peltaster fructicola]